ncbi:hypothetical protein J3E68DRAFT_414001, partial [Trichoderma sp. SZMC 28012]
GVVIGWLLRWLGLEGLSREIVIVLLLFFSHVIGCFLMRVAISKTYHGHFYVSLMTPVGLYIVSCTNLLLDNRSFIGHDVSSVCFI